MKNRKLGFDWEREDTRQSWGRCPAERVRWALFGATGL